MKFDVLDKTGKSIEKVEVEDTIFNAEVNEPLLSQYLRIFNLNQRQGTSSTKTRGEISGGGKKPWKQKGTGRARHGSTRSPLWRHGGIVHGPKPKDWTLKLSKKLKQKAIVSALSAVTRDKEVFVLNELSINEPKTKEVASIIKALGLNRKVLLVVAENDNNVYKSAGNIKDLNISLADNLNAYDLLNANNVLFIKDALIKVNEKYKSL
ncbi:MAG: 50S ribosomal protein L4 [Patescibacteria group bacterium]